MLQYQEALDWLFTQTAVFSRDGASAYKPGLETIEHLCRRLGNPQDKLRCIHVAGTNGKGSTASTLAAIFQSAGLKTALYTSPHLLDFRERIRVDGTMIPQAQVLEFINNYRQNPIVPQPSFFELTTAMAFNWFARQHVDIAIIEVGLGGRLDSTNIIHPVLSVITNISRDHTSLLGNSLAEIAAEKAGIIKHGSPVVIGEAEEPEVRHVFENKAAEMNAPISFASPVSNDFPISLKGEFQKKNAATIMAAMKHFPEISAADILSGFENVERLTGLRGRLSLLATSSHRIIYDTGHNPGAWKYLTKELAGVDTMVIGFAADKDVDSILAMLPRGVKYIFTCPTGNRGLASTELCRKALSAGLVGTAVSTVADAVDYARKVTPQGGTIFVGGSNFVVADFLRAALNGHA